MIAVLVLTLLAAAAPVSSPAAASTPAPRLALDETECLSRAGAAAEREYRRHFKGDWFLHLRSLVQSDQIRSVEVHVGPYDGSVGGGIAARYDCAEDKLVTLEFER
jgi:hypothetical protein